MCAKVWSLNLWIIQIFRENAVFFNSLKTFLIKWIDGTLNGKKEQDSTKNSGSCFWQDLWDDKKRELLLNPPEEGTSMSPHLPNKCQLITFEIHEYKLLNLALWFIVNYYRVYIFATSPQLCAGDKILDWGAAKVQYLSPAHNWGLVAKIYTL